MRALVALAALLLLASCATYRDLIPHQSSIADVQAVMGTAAEKREVGGETWLYYSKQPFGRKMFVARMAADGKLIAVEQRLSEEYIAKLIPNHSRKEDVRDLFGPPYETLSFPRMNREAWSWHMRQFGHLPVGLHVQMSPDGVVREIYLLDEGHSDRRKLLRQLRSLRSSVFSTLP
jgi:hypothetical protein